jgi:hypothetical protein
VIFSIPPDATSALMLLSGAPDTTAFETDVGEVLCLTLRRDDIVMMDNLAVQKISALRGCLGLAGEVTPHRLSKVSLSTMKW